MFFSSHCTSSNVCYCCTQQQTSVNCIRPPSSWFCTFLHLYLFMYMYLCSIFVFVFVFLFYICTAHGREKGENYTDLTSSFLLSSRSRWSPRSLLDRQSVFVHICILSLLISSFYMCICIVWISCPDSCKILITIDIIRFRLPQVTSPIFSWPRIMFSKRTYAYICYN